MNMLSLNTKRPYVICFGCMRTFDLNWNQSTDSVLGKLDKEGRFSVISLTASGKWDKMKFICPDCHVERETYSDQVTFCKTQKEKIQDTLATEIFILRRRLEQLEDDIALISKKKRIVSKKYKETRKEAKRLADAIHTGLSLTDDEEVGSSSARFKGREATDKKDFLHFR